MPFLLILSAILTALTGVVSGVRPLNVQIARTAQPDTAIRASVAVASLLSGHLHLLGGFDVRTGWRAIAAARPMTARMRHLYLDCPRA